MKKFNALAMPLLMLFTGAIVSCSSVTIYDKEVCADLGPYGAECAHTYTEGRRSIPKAEWDKMRVGGFWMSSEAFTDTETSIDQLCTTTNVCSYETKELIKRAKKNLQPLHESAKIVIQQYQEQ